MLVTKVPLVPWLRDCIFVSFGLARSTLLELWLGLDPSSFDDKGNNDVDCQAFSVRMPRDLKRLIRPSERKERKVKLSQVDP